MTTPTQPTSIEQAISLASDACAQLGVCLVYAEQDAVLTGQLLPEHVKLNRVALKVEVIMGQSVGTFGGQTAWDGGTPKS